MTPKLFKEELYTDDKDIKVVINSPGGDCISAASIYNMLMEYPGHVTVMIDGIAASAASVIAMAGDETYVSPVSMMMIHNPSTIAIGDHTDMQKAIDMLDQVKESIINAYHLKTGLSRAKLSHMMESECWMNAYAAIENGFADGLITRDGTPPDKEPDEEQTEENMVKEESIEDKRSVLFSCKAMNMTLLNKLEEHYCKPEPEKEVQEEEQLKGTEGGRCADDIRERLDLMKKFI